MRNFTGIGSPYQAPERAEITIDIAQTDPEEAADIVVAHLWQMGVLRRKSDGPVDGPPNPS